MKKQPSKKGPQSTNRGLIDGPTLYTLSHSVSTFLYSLVYSAYETFQYCCCLFLWCILGNDPFYSPLSLPSLYLHARLPSQDGLGSEKQNNSSNFKVIKCNFSYRWKAKCRFSIQNENYYNRILPQNGIQSYHPDMGCIGYRLPLHLCLQIRHLNRCF